MMPLRYLPDGQSDENLIKAIASGSQSAMRTLYRRHHVRVYQTYDYMTSRLGYPVGNVRAGPSVVSKSSPPADERWGR
jgi:hypothetical protein